MITFMWNLLVGQLCFHKWEISSIKDVYLKEESGLPAYQIYVMACDKCGNIKTQKIG